MLAQLDVVHSMVIPEQLSADNGSPAPRASLLFPIASAQTSRAKQLQHARLMACQAQRSR